MSGGHHRNAPLTVEGRRRLVERCKTRPIAHVASEMGISRATASKWVNRYKRFGDLGLRDRSSTPLRQPSATDGTVIARIEQMRCDHKWSASRIGFELAQEHFAISRRTITRAFAQLGPNRRRFIDPAGESNREPQRIIAERPGHMIHVDNKKVGRIPTGGGWRVHGRASPQARAVDRAKRRGTRASYAYLHSAIDGDTRASLTQKPWRMRRAQPLRAFSTGRRRGSPSTGSPRSNGSSPTTVRAIGRKSSPRASFLHGSSGSSPTHHSTTEKSSDTTESSLRSSSTPAPGSQSRNAPTRS